MAGGSIADVPVASTGFVGARPTRAEEKTDHTPLSKEEMLKRGFRYVKWDGKLVVQPVWAGSVLIPLRRTTIPILDCKDRTFAVLVGSPKSEDWPEVMEDICTKLNGAREELVGSAEASKPPVNRRGCFTPLASGISYGGGQKVIFASTLWNAF